MVILWLGCRCFLPSVRERPFNLKGWGYGFFLKKYSDCQCCWKNILILVKEKKIIWFRVLVINYCWILEKINILTLVLSETKFLNEAKNHNPPFKLKWSVPYGPTDSKFANPFRLNKELTPFFVYFLVKYINITYIFFIWTVTHQSLNFIFFKKHLNHSITKHQTILWIRNWYVHQINASNNVLSFIVYKCYPNMPFSFQFLI